MSAFKAARNSREIHLVAAGIDEGAREILMALAKAAPSHLKATYIRGARQRHHNMLANKRAAEARQLVNCGKGVL